MTSAIAALAALGPDAGDEFPDAPDADLVLAPPSLDDLAGVLRTASDHGVPVVVWGGGTHQGIGYPVDAGVALVTRRLDRVVDWQPEDLTVVVEGGTPVAVLEEMLAERNQTAVLPETGDGATVGGVVAAGLSGLRRLGYGPTRDRVLEVELATGDGRLVTAGGRVVKNVTGYDIPRLVAGSLGALGVVGAVCLKLWPVPSHAGTIPVPDAAAARQAAHRPLAVLETESGAHVYVAGTEQAVEGQAASLGSVAEPGLRWPKPLDAPWVLSLRVPAAVVVDAVARVRTLPGLAGFRAAHGVGEVEVGVDDLDAPSMLRLRRWAEATGGALVTMRRPPSGAAEFDPWGRPPAGVDIQRRIKSAFDPAGIVNPGRLPGRI